MTPPDRLTAALADRYRIERELGAGGMATVYLAEDLKHKRKVAIKVLKPELAAVLGAERFVQEITTTAALSHPHILPLFDSGEAGGFLYYVMPYLQGETIREKLNRETQFGIDEAVRIATEVADALDYAHQNGVIHRDIKPENILLHNGRPMVMDFGIALAVSAAAGGRMTETGLSLGTPHYMSPEQATADKQITARSDVYSLASVLYEMLTGNPPHTGSSAQQIIMKIIAEPVQPATAVRKSVPSNISAAMDTALEKLPADRFDSAAKFAEALRNPAFGAITPGSGVMGAMAGRGDWRTRAAIPLAVVSVVFLALAAASWLRRPEGSALPGRFEVPLQSSRMMGVGGVTISPDGRYIVYVSPTEGVILRPRSELEGTKLASVAVDAAWAPFFSPDGTQLGYETGFPGSLMVASITGGTSRLLIADSSSGYGGAFGDDGSIYYSSARGVLMRIPPDGGEPRVMAKPDSTRQESMLLSPDILPGQRGALVTIFGAGRPKIGVVDFPSSSVRVLTDGIIARFGAPDYVFVGRDNGDLVAIPFDARRLKVTGPEVVMGDKMRSSFGGYTTSLSVAKSGDIAYLASNLLDGAVVRVDRAGRATPADPDWRDVFSGLALSPDGRSLAISRYLEGRDEIWLKTMDRGPLVRLSFGGILSYRPTWSTDGRFIYFVSDRDASRPAAVYRVSATGGGDAERVYETDAPVDEVEWSPDGKWLVYRSGSGGGRNIYAKRWGADDPPVPIAVSEFEERSPTVSPDGRFIAYASDESGRAEVYVRPFPDATSAKWPVSTRGGSEPRWAHGGRELFYRSADGMLQSVRLGAGPGFSIASEEPLFSTRTFHDEGMHSLYDVLPDDRGFLFIQLQSEVRGRIVLIQNWRQAVEERRAGMRR